MVMVRSIRVHTNAYGDSPRKPVGTEYDLPENLVPTLSDVGLVEEVKAKEAKAK